MAKLIYDLLKYDSKCSPGKKQPLKKKCRPKKKTYQVPSSAPVSWSEKHQGALSFLTDCLTSPPVMAYPACEIPFVLHTDTSQRSSIVSKAERKNVCNWICFKNSRILSS